jgi:hypothetical protein
LLARQLWPVLWLVFPFASGSVVQTSVPTWRASTNRKSQSASVLYDVQNVRAPPPPGTVTVRDRLLNDTSAIWEYAYESPVCGSNGPPGRS